MTHEDNDASRENKNRDCRPQKSTSQVLFEADTAVHFQRCLRRFFYELTAAFMKSFTGPDYPAFCALFATPGDIRVPSHNGRHPRKETPRSN
jgi:hypothetical protein